MSEHLRGPDGRLIELVRVGRFRKRYQLRSVGYGDERLHLPNGLPLSEREMRWLIVKAGGR